ncbi:MAG: hypothetical protein M1827_006293 [Pycnora praestabilis]|nr:MAG: hypothetical protein M1827_006293 [Pycnora praestabilis]
MLCQATITLAVIASLCSQVAAVDATRNPSLVAQLKTAATQLDRLNLLPENSDWLFDFTTQPNYTFSPGSVINANAATFPAAVGNGLTMAMLNLGPCSMLPPHYHPRASNYVVAVAGTTNVYFIEENGARLVTNTLTPGKMTIFPAASLHTMVNTGCTNSQLVSALSSEDSGTQNVANALFGLPLDLVNVALGGSDNVNQTKGTIPGVGTGSISASEPAPGDRPRSPPPPATAVEFPNYTPPQSFTPFDHESADSLPRLFAKIKTPSDINEDHLNALNIKLRGDTPLDEIIPGSNNDKLSFLPPRTWIDPPTKRSASEAFEQSSPETTSSSAKPSEALSNGVKAPGQDVFFARAQELLFDNDDAFREISRLEPLPGRPPAKPRHFRNFWMSLDLMSQFWETSADEITDIDNRSDDNVAMNVDQLREVAQEEEGKDGKVKDQGDSDLGQDDRKRRRSYLLHELQKAGLDRKAFDKMTAKEMDLYSSIPDKAQDLSKRKGYTGRRIGSGRDMPEQYREDTVKTFVETIGWAYGCQVTLPRLPPRLTISNMYIPVRHSSIVYRSVTDRQRARQGIVEGPLMVLQCRPETNFLSSPDESSDDGGTDSFRNLSDTNGSTQEAMLDLLRELGALLLLAQERFRETQTPQSSGSGQWYMTRLRWGGGPGGEIGNEGSNSDEEMPSKTSNRSRTTKDKVSAKRKHEAYKTLRPGVGVWDQKVVYKRIGKERESEFDNVFMISSIFHHISILRLRVHSKYLQHLTAGTLGPSRAQPPPTSTTQTTDQEDQQPWYVLQLQRTRWYDLFQADDRVEAMRGVWGVMRWLMRAEGDEEGTEDEAMSEADA